MFLLDDMVKGIFRGMTWVTKQVYEEVAREIGDENTIIKRLLELNMKYEQGEISLEDFEEVEKLLFERLEIIQAQQAAEHQENELEDTEEDDEWLREYAELLTDESEEE